MYEANEILDKLPRHLMDLVIDQPYNKYTSQDHAVWRYVMRQNINYLGKVAHGSYLNGLKKTGISIDRIPHMYGMNRILKEIGWAAVAVDGFIPPSAFMEFQAYNVLVIAADIRPANQIEYTPAPDIIHEAAGHAPIIADEEYADYLKLFGEIGSKALSSARDYQLYEAIRHLSILKADPYSSESEIREAEKNLDKIAGSMGEPSEMAMIRNLHWWTVEYGLVGDLKNPKIYGAGLLSSIGESYSCLQEQVKKIPYSLEAKDCSFDITTRQPQLFVTPDFKHLTTVLNQFADTMALRTGGTDGMIKAIKSSNVATAVYSSGLQVSGIFNEIIKKQDQLIYIRTNSPTSLSYKDIQLDEHGKDYHFHGFGSPVGRLKNAEAPLEMLCEADLAMMDIRSGKNVTLEFESGVLVKGKLESILKKDQKIILMTFSNCTVTYEDQILFAPDWGIFDMAAGERIVSVFSGPADALAYGLSYQAPKEKTHKIEHDEKAKKLHLLYKKVQETRDSDPGKLNGSDLLQIIKNEYPEDWLLAMEMLEIYERFQPDALITKEIREYLELKKIDQPELTQLINNGLMLVKD